MNRNSIWRAASGVLERQSIVGELGKITAPTLVMVGDEDTSTPKALGDRIVGGIANAKLIVIPGAGHGATLEQPAIVTAAIGSFLDARSGAVPARGAAAA
jgi:3-oxoadipate enol-lactonase